MNIAIDGNEANVEKRVGSGEYAYELIKHLSFYQNKHQFTIFLKNPPRTDLPPATANWKYIVIKPKPLWTRFALPFRLLTTRNLELIFSPSHYGPHFSPIPSIISIMDLSYVYYPQMFNKTDLLQLKKWTGYSVKKAKKIITISKYSRNSIIDYYQVDPKKIYVTYLGYNRKVYHSKYKKEEIQEVKQQFNIDDYLLFVGTIQPRKNLLRLIEAFLKITNNYPSLKLIIVGKKGWLYEDIFKQIEKDKKKIIYLGYLENRTIAKLYCGAKAYILPSLYEGFGLTVVEAMACGCPVVLSKVSSLPEIAKDAAVYVDPKSTDSISEGVLKVIQKDQKYYRKEMINKGFSIANSFSWEDCAAKTIKVFEGLNKE